MRLRSLGAKLLFNLLVYLLQVWRQTLWTDIRTDVMEEGTKAFVKEVKALPKAVRDEDCFKVGALALIHLACMCTGAYICREAEDFGTIVACELC